MSFDDVNSRMSGARKEVGTIKCCRYSQREAPLLRIPKSALPKRVRDDGKRFIEGSNRKPLTIAALGLRLMDVRLGNISQEFSGPGTARAVVVFDKARIGKVTFC